MLDLIEFIKVLHRLLLYRLNQLCVRLHHQLSLLVDLRALERADGLPVHPPIGIIRPSLVLLEHLQGGVQLILVLLVLRGLLLEGVSGGRRFDGLLLRVCWEHGSWLVGPLLP